MFDNSDLLNNTDKSINYHISHLDSQKTKIHYKTGLITCILVPSGIIACEFDDRMSYCVLRYWRICALLLHASGFWPSAI